MNRYPDEGSSSANTSEMTVTPPLWQTASKLKQKTENSDVFKAPFAVKKDKRANHKRRWPSQEDHCRTPPPWIGSRRLPSLCSSNSHKNLSGNSLNKPTVLQTPDLKGLKKTNIPLTPLMRTPNVSLTPFLSAANLALTPLLKMHNMAITPLINTPSVLQGLQVTSSDLTGSIPLENLSTPALFQATRPDNGQVDLLTLIDDDNIESEILYRKLGNYNEDLELIDSIVPDYIMDIVDDYKHNTGQHSNNNVSRQNRNSTTSSTSAASQSQPVTPVKDMPQPQVKCTNMRRGQFCKRMPKEMEEIIQTEQRKKNKMTRKRKKRNEETTEDCIKRRVNSGRRTRSLVKAAQDRGVDLDSYVIKSDSKEE